MNPGRYVAALTAAIALVGCAGGSRAPADSARGPAAAPGVQVAAAPPLAGLDLSGGQPPSGGTFVGQKVRQLHGDLAALQASIAAHNAQLQGVRSAMVGDAQAYFTTVAGVNARLQAGTTPGNPMLQRQWNQAQSELARIDGRVGQLNELANRVATDAALASYLMEAIRAAYEIPGAVDEDHHRLRALEDEVSGVKALIDRLLAEINADVARQTSYLGGERQRLAELAAAIKQGELHGGAAAAAAPAYAAPAYAAPGYAAPGYAPSSTVAFGGRPLVVIRFDQPNVAYEQPLYTAISQALERRPGASFEIVAVSPGASSAGARRNADRVLRSLAGMGLPRDRIRMSAASGGGGADEVHIYIR